MIYSSSLKEFFDIFIYILRNNLNIFKLMLMSLEIITEKLLRYKSVNGKCLNMKHNLLKIILKQPSKNTSF